MAGTNATMSCEIRPPSSVQSRCPAAIWRPAPSIGPSSTVISAKNGSSMAICSFSDQPNSSPLRTSLPSAVRKRRVMGKFIIGRSAPLTRCPAQRVQVGDPAQRGQHRDVGQQPGQGALDHAAPSPRPASVVLSTSTPRAVGTSRAKISTPCGNSVMGMNMPPKNMIVMLNTCTTAPMLAIRSVRAVISSA